MRVLAKVLGLTLSDNINVQRDPVTLQWWLCGCIEGDQPLPQTNKCNTAKEALEASSAWFAPEIYALAVKNGMPLSGRYA